MSAPTLNNKTLEALLKLAVAGDPDDAAAMLAALTKLAASTSKGKTTTAASPAKKAKSKSKSKTLVDDAEEVKYKTARLCRGMNKHGEPCGRKTRSVSGFCFHHEGGRAGAAPARAVKRAGRQCRGTNKHGERCGKKTRSESGFCVYHE